MFVALRGSYTGVLMVGLLTCLAGMALVNPYSVAAGVVLGRKAYKDDAAARLQRRRNEAKAAVRRYIDEVVFQVNKHLKDRLRLVNRTLRDLIGDRVREMSRTLARRCRPPSRGCGWSPPNGTRASAGSTRQLQRVQRLTAQARRGSTPRWRAPGDGAEQPGRRPRPARRRPRLLRRRARGGRPRCAPGGDRLDGPLRVALVGRVKAGKSTLLNALAGERLAPTDAGECTRVVTEYRHGPVPRVALHGRDGQVRALPVRRERRGAAPRPRRDPDRAGRPAGRRLAVADRCTGSPSSTPPAPPP